MKKHVFNPTKPGNKTCGEILLGGKCGRKADSPIHRVSRPTKDHVHHPFLTLFAGGRLCSHMFADGVCGKLKTDVIHSDSLTLSTGYNVNHTDSTIAPTAVGNSGTPHYFKGKVIGAGCRVKYIDGQKCGLLMGDPIHTTMLRTSALATFESGATRTPKAERRELIPKSAVDALGRRLRLGADKHGVNNWRKGGAEFRLATVNHLLDHIFEYLEYGGKENTDAIICNAAFLCEMEEREAYKGVKL